MKHLTNVLSVAKYKDIIIESLIAVDKELIERGINVTYSFDNYYSLFSEFGANLKGKNISLIQGDNYGESGMDICIGKDEKTKVPESSKTYKQLSSLLLSKFKENFKKHDLFLRESIVDDNFLKFIYVGNIDGFKNAFVYKNQKFISLTLSKQQLVDNAKTFENIVVKKSNGGGVTISYNDFSRFNPRVSNVDEMYYSFGRTRVILKEPESFEDIQNTNNVSQFLTHLLMLKDLEVIENTETELHEFDGKNNSFGSRILTLRLGKTYEILDLDNILHDTTHLAHSRRYDILIINPEAYKCANNYLTDDEFDKYKGLNNFIERFTTGRVRSKYEFTKIEKRFLSVSTCTRSGLSYISNDKLRRISTDSSYLHQFKEVDGGFEYKSILSYLAKYTVLLERLIYSKDNYNVYKSRKMKEDVSSVISNGFFEYARKVNGYGSSIRLSYIDTDENTEAKSGVLYLGPELEIDDGGNNDDNANAFISALTGYKPHAWITRDGSVGNGFEVKTVPATIEAHLNSEIFDYDDAFKLAKELGYTGGENNSCGLHVHASKSYFSDLTPTVSDSAARNYAGYYLVALLENLWEKGLVKFTRRNSDRINQWSANHSRTSTMSGRFSGVDSLGKLNDFCRNLTRRYREDKYSAVFIKDYTFEFRLFRSTLNLTTYKATLQFVNNLMAFTKQRMLEMLNNYEENETPEILEKWLAEPFNVDLKTIVEFRNFDELDKYFSNIEEYIKD